MVSMVSVEFGWRSDDAGEMSQMEQCRSHCLGMPSRCCIYIGDALATYCPGPSLDHRAHSTTHQFLPSRYYRQPSTTLALYHIDVMNDVVGNGMHCALDGCYDDDNDSRATMLKPTTAIATTPESAHGCKQAATTTTTYACPTMMCK